MKFQYINDTISYTGKELVSHWIYQNFGILGDAAVAFCGPCDVNIHNMVDLEDVRNNDFIYSENMLHFVIEIFNTPLEEGVLIQRLFTSILQDRLNTDAGHLIVKRCGDDLFFEKTKKLSVSICTVSPTSILIHTGLNINPAGVPVSAAGLDTDLKITKHTTMTEFANRTMRALADEWDDIKRCTCKVKAVI